MMEPKKPILSFFEYKFSSNMADKMTNMLTLKIDLNFGVASFCCKSLSFMVEQYHHFLLVSVMADIQDG